MNDYIIHLLMMPRKHIPRIQDFVVETVTMYSTDDFRTHFRLNRTTFEIILNIIAPSLTAVHDGGKKEITPEKQLLLFIWYLANQESMRETGNLFGVSLSTVHKIVIKVTSALKEGFLNVIQWLDPAAQNITAQSFQLASGFPGIIGVLDGTHIRLSSPIGGDSDYINCKGYPSIQLQIVVDHNLKIISAHTGWPGCAHDARVLRNSTLFTRGENGALAPPNMHIIADSAYPLKQWLITPFRDNGHLSNQQKRFNLGLSSCRQIVERAIGHLKGRFRRLREICFHDPELICSYIIVGCIMHNLCIIHDDDIEEFVDVHQNQHPNHYNNSFQNAYGGIQKRQQLLNMLR